LDASTIARAARGARRPAALSRPETDAAADDDGRSCLANLPMAEILETGTRPEAASTRRAPLEHAGTARIEARDAISDVSLGFEPPQTRRGPDAPWRRSERREGEGARDVTSSRRKNRRSTDARGPRRSRATPDGDALRAPRGEKRRSANAAARRTMATSRPARASRRKRRLRAYYESGRFFSRNGGLLRPQETCRRVFLVWERRECGITCGLRRLPFSHGSD
jgi:hypothetical protein